MAQERVRDRIAKGVPGLPFGDSNDFVSKTNQNPQAEQVEQVTVATAADDTDYTLEINGVTVTYTSGAGATKETIRDGLISAVEDEPLVSGHAVPEPGGSTDVLTLTSTWPGESFEFSEADANLTSSTVNAGGEADPIPFGRAVVLDGLDLSEGGQGGQLAKAATLTVRSVTLTVSDTSGDTYTVEVEVEGRTYRAEHTSAGGGDNAVATALQSDLEASLPTDTVSASVNGSELTLDAETAGRPFGVSFDVEGGNGGSISVASETAGRMTSLAEALVGVTAIKHMTAYDGDGAQIGPNDIFDALEGGRIIVDPETAIAAGDDVWVRLAANGQNDELGRFRGDKDTGCVKLPNASWHGTFGDDLAVLTID